jgi:hypothetical protein
MRFLRTFIIIAVLIVAAACGGSSEPASPLKTFQTYTVALKKKDTTTMKLLLSSETIKMLEQEAKSQGVPLDDVVKRETLFTESMKTVEFRNEKIEGEKATIEVKNGQKWETIPFVRENSEWKIDKKGYAELLIQEIQRENDAAFDQAFPQNNQPF